MARRVRLDHAGIAAFLKGDEVREVVVAAAEGIAETARQAETINRHGAEITVETYTTDRAAAAVTIVHPGGAGMEAKYGVLQNAAGATGGASE